MKTLGTTFSNDSRFVMIISGGNTAVKICEQNSHGEWTEKATIQHKDKIHSFTFSSDSRHVVTSDRSGTVQIYSQMANDRWIQRATTRYMPQPRLQSNYIKHNNVSVAVSADSRQILISSTANTAITIYGWTSNDEWIKSCILDIGVGTGIKQATFSADGSHLIIVVAHTIKIYGLDSTDHTWKEKAKFKHIGLDTASISADGGHVVTVDRHKIAKIWRLFREENVRCNLLQEKNEARS
jgi:WD40 repeat protein